MSAAATHPLPPHDRDAERAVLGGVLRDPPVLADVSAVVGPGAFYFDAHQRIFAAAQAVAARGPLDLVTLHDELRRAKHLADAGGAAYLSDLWNAVPTGALAAHHAGLVRDAALPLGLIHNTNETLGDAYLPAAPTGEVLATVERELAAVIAFARSAGPMRRDETAGAVWREVYPVVSGERCGLAGSLTGRAEAHVLRLSLIYAVLDRSPVVRQEHLLAALAVWDYAEQSVLCLFGDSTGNPIADDIIALLRNAPSGMTRTEIRDMVGKNVSSERVAQALGVLVELNRARFERRDTGGRPAELWFLTAPAGGAP
ncbi:MAG: hypothetical protein FJ304_05460 [Planctomycetes bacterium]|nr:hypothetical protein [Planctomycetota bacterium]